MPARPSNAAQAATDDARFDSFAVRWLTGGKRRGAGGKAQKASEMTVTPEQCKAGRELLGWSRIRLRVSGRRQREDCFDLRIGRAMVATARPRSRSQKARSRRRRVHRRERRGAAGRETSERGEMTITPGQVIAARKMLNWSQSDLAAYVGATKASIVAFESRERWPVDLDLIRAVFEDSGVEFIADLGGAPGVRLRKAGK